VVARESCRVLRVPIAAIKRHAEQDDQLARTLERIAREDLARFIRSCGHQPSVVAVAQSD
jgi:hypothetical protein